MSDPLHPVQCPVCGAWQTLVVDEDTEGSLVQDCEVCCAPWAITVRRSRSGRATVSVERLS